LILWLLAACVRTPPHPPLGEAVTVRTERRERALDEEGRGCAWEEESLWVGERRLIGADPPDALDWCAKPTDHWRTLDVLGQDGAFVSLEQDGSDGVRTCGTIDTATGAWATLDAYDPKHAKGRVRRALRLLAGEPSEPGFDPDRFVVGGGHVRFCWRDATGRRHDLDVP
jgi:hypothetical protein